MSLRSANLVGADLTGANLMRADLFLADLSGATITNLKLHFANLNGTNFMKATGMCCMDGAHFYQSINVPDRIKLILEEERNQWAIKQKRDKEKEKIGEVVTFIIASIPILFFLYFMYYFFWSRI
jgi:hypothetical protein